MLLEAISEPLIWQTRRESQRALMFLVKKIQLAICSGRFYGSIVRYIDRNLPLYRPHSNGSVAPAVSRTDQAHPSILRSDAKEH